MENPLKEYGFCKTPESFQEIQEFASRSNTAADANRVMMFTMNLCAKIVQDAIDLEHMVKHSDKLKGGS